MLVKDLEVSVQAEVIINFILRESFFASSPGHSQGGRGRMGGRESNVKNEMKDDKI